MDGQEEEGGNLCAPECKEEVRHELTCYSWAREKGEVDMDKVTKARSEGVDCGEGEIAIPGRPEVGYTMDRPTVEATHEGRVATPGADTVADVEEKCEFEPSQLWLLLKEAEYESW